MPEPEPKREPLRAEEERDRRFKLAQKSYAQGSLEEAGRIATDLLQSDPQFLPAKLLLGIVYGRTGDLNQAVRLLEEVAKDDPGCLEALITLSKLYRAVARFQDAVAISLQAVKVRPDLAQTNYHLGLSWMAVGRFDHAAGSFAETVKIDPTLGLAYLQLGKTWQALGAFPEAVRAFENACRLGPTLEGQIGLAQSLNRLERFRSALDAGQKAIQLDPKSVAARLSAARALLGLGELEEARPHLEIAAGSNLNASEWFSLALMQRLAGAIEDSNSALRKAIQADPSHPAPYSVLIHNSKVTEVDRELVSRMERLLEKPAIPPKDLGALHYGLGKAFEDLGEYENAMDHYDQANAIARTEKLGDAPFDREGFSRKVDLAIQTSSPEAIAKGIQGTTSSELPILILGMMRSGTTFFEQVLSSHPQIHGGGELPYWMQNWLTAISHDSLLPNRVVSLGIDYVELLKRISRDKVRVTDKMPMNMLAAGMIHLALPNARIVHMRRDPLDTALSIWATPNEVPSDGGHEKANLVFVVKELQRLMAHYRKVLPADRFLEVDYEGLVLDLEGTARKVVAFCGLEWSESCLRPHENRRTVSTPSMWQVRQPVYGSSVGRGRKFEPWLGELSELSSLSSERD